MITNGSLGFTTLPAAGILSPEHPANDGPLDGLPVHGAAALLREVLVDAIRVYCRSIALGGTWTPEYREARRWLFAEKSRSLISFGSLCEVFALNTADLRRSLRLFPYEPDPRLLRLSRLVDCGPAGVPELVDQRSA